MLAEYERLKEEKLNLQRNSIPPIDASLQVPGGNVETDGKPFILVLVDGDTNQVRDINRDSRHC